MGKTPLNIALYTDPFLLEEKIRGTSKEGMVDVFLGAWSPLVEFEQLSLHSLAQGLLYWDALAPIGDRWKDIDVSAVATRRSAAKNWSSNVC